MFLYDHSAANEMNFTVNRKLSILQNFRFPHGVQTHHQYILSIKRALFCKFKEYVWHKSKFLVGLQEWIMHGYTTSYVNGLIN